MKNKFFILPLCFIYVPMHAMLARMVRSHGASHLTKVVTASARTPIAQRTASTHKPTPTQQLISVVFAAEKVRHASADTVKSKRLLFEKLSSKFFYIDEATKKALLSPHDATFEETKRTLYKRVFRTQSPWYWPRVATFRGTPGKTE